MEQQQKASLHSKEACHFTAREPEEMRSMANSGWQQWHDLTRLRIERNRAARHARCASMRK